MVVVTKEEIKSFVLIRGVSSNNPPLGNGNSSYMKREGDTGAAEVLHDVPEISYSFRNLHGD